MEINEVQFAAILFPNGCEYATYQELALLFGPSFPDVGLAIGSLECDFVSGPGYLKFGPRVPSSKVSIALTQESAVKVKAVFPKLECPDVSGRWLL